VTDDQIKLLDRQLKLEKEFACKFTDLSLADTILQLLQIKTPKAMEEAHKLKQMFKVSDKKLLSFLSLSLMKS
jgi:hypothetical protein